MTRPLESAPLDHVPTQVLWDELIRRGAALRVGRCYPAMCSDEAATALVHEHGYEWGPFQFIEIGERLDEEPQWAMYAAVPEQFRRPK